MEEFLYSSLSMELEKNFNCFKSTALFWSVLATNTLHDGGASDFTYWAVNC